MIIALPVSSDSAQTFITQLGSTKYKFDLRWNERAQVWCLDIAIDSTQEVLLSGVPVVLGCDLLQPYQLGIGSLMAVDESATGTEASFNDLGSRVNLYWFSPDEVANAT